MGIGNPVTSTIETDDELWMARALELARCAEALGEVPVGAVLVREGRTVAEGFNTPIRLSDPTAHAEIVALREGGRSEGNYRLVGCTLYVTLEPCVMCMGAILNARLQRLVFGATDPLRGAVCSQLQLTDASFANHRVAYRGGVLAEACGQVLRNFFQTRR
ncbi:tRNA adenosine(34) deaminase TadA [Methylotetracoccus oryzae]|uniref:tRNA adenosine(34) deaminase TadA n=1 Tax=Methylotetracoccus oryzae TaxID=1919059 RepID=UPI0022A7BB82|nr:tRNA adenosine(34) deaminase TadA [Methylotetracoccus oryzae]